MEAGGKQLKVELMEARQAPVKGKTSWPPTSSRTSSKKSLSKASQVWPLRLQGKKGDLGKRGGLEQSSCRDTGEGKKGVEDKKSHSPSPSHPEAFRGIGVCVAGTHSSCTAWWSRAGLHTRLQGLICIIRSCRLQLLL